MARASTQQSRSVRDAETKQFILYLDNARYQHARAVREWVEAHKAQGVEFVLDFLPASSPNRT